MAASFRWFAWMAGSILLCLAGGCHRGGSSSPAVKIEVEVAPQPVKVGPVLVTMRVTDARGGPVTRARLTVEGDMSHPGMSPVFSEASEIGEGRYQSQMNLAMAGDWVLLVHLKLPDGQAVERQVDVKGVRAE